MDGNLSAELAHASAKNPSLRRLLEKILDRLEAVESRGGGGAAMPDLPDWLFGSETIPDNKIPTGIVRQSEMDSAINSASPKKKAAKKS